MNFMLSFVVYNDLNKNRSKKQEIGNITKWHVKKWRVKLKCLILIYGKNNVHEKLN